MRYQIKPYGDRGLLIEFDQKIDSLIHQKVMQLKEAVLSASWSGLSFAIPAYCSLTLGFDPTQTNFEKLKDQMEAFAENLDGAPLSPLPYLDIPVCYEEEFGLDLSAVSQETALSIPELITLHQSVPYQVYMIGFLPGFPYLGLLPDALQVSRKAIPRKQVPPGSVAIAGQQTGIYPSAAPGGWQIIGRTPLRLFAAQREPACLLQAGQEVRFRAISKSEFNAYTRREVEEVSDGEVLFDPSQLENRGDALASTKRSNTAPSQNNKFASHQVFQDEDIPTKDSICYLDILKAGLMTTIQDSGRSHLAALGVPRGGFLDRRAAHTANTLVGNQVDAPLLEITLYGPRIRFSGTCCIAITGAHLSASLNGSPIPSYQSIDVSAGSILAFGQLVHGCRAYLAVGGQWQLEKMLGSFSPLYRGKAEEDEFGWLKKGTKIPIATNRMSKNNLSLKPSLPSCKSPLQVRVLPGPEFKIFDQQNIAYFFSYPFQLSKDCNRMGLRLNGPSIKRMDAAEMISSAVLPGTVQITSSGQAILLLADAQTTGGYPRIVQVIDEDLDQLAQLKPGDSLSFVMFKSVIGNSLN